MKYVLNIVETIRRSHEVTIETDRDIESVCNDFENNNIVSDCWDADYIDGISVLNVEEGADDISEFEVEEYSEVGKEGSEE